MKKIKNILLSLLLTFGVFGAVFGQYVNGSNFYQNVDKKAQFCSNVRNVLAQGYQSGGVKELQWMLQQYYHPGLQATDYFGPVTKYAVKLFQGQHGIRQTGAMGPQTLAEMRSLWCSGTVNPVNPIKPISPVTPVSPLNPGVPVISISPVSSAGNNITLAWNTQNAVSCNINGENVTPNGSKNYVAYVETNFKISCTNSYGKSSESTVTVRPNNGTNNTSAPVIAFNVNPSSFVSGQNVVLSWNVSNANSCTLNNFPVSTSESQNIIVPYAYTSYVLTCNGAGGTASKSINFGSNTNSTNMPTLDVTGSMYQFAQTGICTVGSVSPCNGTGYITVSTTNANSCTISGGIYNNSNISTNTSFNVSPTTTTTYNVTCTGNGNTVTKSITLTPNQTGGNTGSNYLNLTQSNVTVGGVLNLNWTAPTEYSGYVQGVILSLYDMNNNFLGQVTRTANSGSGSYAWTVPVAVSNPNNDAHTCKTINGVQVCGGSPINELVTGTYKIRATFFTPYNACFGFCQQVSGQKTLGFVESSNFTINSNSSFKDKISLNTTFNKTSYIRGEQIVVTVKVTNNGSTTIDYPVGSSSCPADVKLFVDGVDFNTFTNQINKACTMDYQYMSLKPGESYFRTFSGYISNSVSVGTKNVLAQLVNQSPAPNSNSILASDLKMTVVY